MAVRPGPHLVDSIHNGVLVGIAIAIVLDALRDNAARHKVRRLEQELKTPTTPDIPSARTALKVGQPVQLQVGGETYDGVVGSINWTVGDLTAQVIVWDQVPAPLDPNLWNWGD